MLSEEKLLERILELPADIKKVETEFAPNAGKVALGLTLPEIDPARQAAEQIRAMFEARRNALVLEYQTIQYVLDYIRRNYGEQAVYGPPAGYGEEPLEPTDQA
jgi:hypothetical protein